MLFAGRNGMKIVKMRMLTQKYVVELPTGLQMKKKMERPKAHLR
jgi:hypothetical protein